MEGARNLHLSREFWKRRRGPASSSSPTSTNKTDTRRRTAGKSGHVDRVGEGGQGWNGVRKKKKKINKGGCGEEEDAAKNAHRNSESRECRQKPNLGHSARRLKCPINLLSLISVLIWNVSENTVSSKSVNQKDASRWTFFWQTRTKIQQEKKLKSTETESVTRGREAVGRRWGGGSQKGRDPGQG